MPDKSLRGVKVLPTQFSAIIPLSTAICLLSIQASSTHAQTIPAVSQDPTIVFTLSASGAIAKGTISTNAVQYFSGGTPLGALAFRNLLDFYGVAVPKTSQYLGQLGAKGFQPFNSPRVNFSQFNYCNNSNSTFIFVGLSAPPSCSYVSATSGIPTIIPAPNQAPIPLPNPPSASYGFTDFVSTNPLPTPLFVIQNGGTNVPPGVISSTASSPLTNASVINPPINSYVTNKLPTRGNPIQVPVSFGALVPIVNPGINGGVSPNLTTVDLCKIYDGEYTNYSQVTGTQGLSGSINLVVRTSKSGGYLLPQRFNDYLISICTSAGLISPGYTTYLPLANNFYSVVGKPDNVSMSDYVATTSGGFGFVEADFAQPYATNAPITPNTPAPIQAAIQNPVSGSFVRANLSAIRAALGNISVGVDSTYPCILTISGLPTVTTFGNAYPFVEVAYALAYTNYSTQAEVDALKGVFSFILGNSTTPIQANDQIAPQFGSVILGKGTTASATNPLRQQARACINSAKVGVGSN
jgi:ABC-type phosphate transport system substrate-binding protein